MSAKTRYDAVAITLHWVIALGILAQICMGLGMVHLALPIGLKFKIYQLHKSIGLTILLAVILRVLWRVFRKPPDLPATMPALERKAAHGMHHLLYLLMVFIPLSGWLITSLSPLHIPTVLYGILPWPFLPVPDGWVSRASEMLAGSIHAWAAYIILAAVTLHVLAVIRHQFLLKDGTLGRMLPFLRRPQ